LNAKIVKNKLLSGISAVKNGAKLDYFLKNSIKVFIFVELSDGVP